MDKDEIEAMISGTIFGIILIFIGGTFLTTNATGPLGTFYNNVGWGFVFVGSLLIGVVLIFIIVKGHQREKAF
jgi:hypothetical protein